MKFILLFLNGLLLVKEKSIEKHINAVLLKIIINISTLGYTKESLV